ncbi:hypothetical protein CTAYLR_006400 [Chrysophaeum taylorii]|uniref:Uncharacterized protein n=1 Tax=Chrysophaeum taylorii TaxID=2483200 RepID=A0AAD7XIC3_9STRA|nr:hypothetical protein CTAYLR_006400 [Chrysophaeum taylorii]
MVVAGLRSKERSSTVSKKSVSKRRDDDITVLGEMLRNCSLSSSSTKPMIVSESKRAQIVADLNQRGYHLLVSRRRVPAALVVLDEKSGALVDHLSGRALEFRPSSSAEALRFQDARSTDAFFRKWFLSWDTERKVPLLVAGDDLFNDRDANRRRPRVSSAYAQTRWPRIRGSRSLHKEGTKTCQHLKLISREYGVRVAVSSSNAREEELIGMFECWWIQDFERRRLDLVTFLISEWLATLLECDAAVKIVTSVPGKHWFDEKGTTDDVFGIITRILDSQEEIPAETYEDRLDATFVDARRRDALRRIVAAGRGGTSPALLRAPSLAQWATARVALRGVDWFMGWQQGTQAASRANRHLDVAIPARAKYAYRFFDDKGRTYGWVYAQLVGRGLGLRRALGLH